MQLHALSRPWLQNPRAPFDATSTQTMPKERVQKEREEWRKLKEAEAEEYRQLMLAASKEEVEKLAAEKAAKEAEVAAEDDEDDDDGPEYE